MKKNSSYNRGKRKKGRKKKEDARLVNFTSLQQVAGGPKPYKFHSRIPVNEIGTVKEPNTECALCGKKIENIALALKEGEAFVHFNCALEKVKAENPLHEGESLSYAGKGNFAIFSKSEEGKWVTVKKIPFESAEDHESMKTYVQELKHD